MSHDRPRLRFVDATPIVQDEDHIVVLRDPEGLNGRALAVPLPTFVLMTLLDGTRDPREVQAEIQRRHQQLIPIEAIESLIGQLDEAYLLENERSRIRREDLVREFERAKSRPAVHAGASYPAEPEEIDRVFAEYFKAAVGSDEKRPLHRRAPRGLITPHIDIRQGGACMARAFDRLRSKEPPECYIILGVAHHPTPNLFTLTDKDFETPLGTVETNKAAADRLRVLYGTERLTGQYAHKIEHSIEFQTIFLKYVHRDDHKFTILPILCGPIEEELHQGEAASPREFRPDVDQFCRALSVLMGELGPRVCVIAGVDLSHVGKKFGDAEGVNDLRSDLVRTADLRMLESVTDRDPEAFFDHFRPDRNARKVDAVSAVYSMLHVLGPGEAELLHYDQYREVDTESLVSYASLAFY